MTTFLQDLRYGLRMLRQNPGFTAVAVLALGLGIGANSAIFSVVSAMLLRPLPYSDPDRLVTLYEKRAQQGRERNVVSAPDFVDWRAQNQVFTGMDAYLGWLFNLTSDEEPERLGGALVSAGLFETLGVKPVVGRTFAPEEDQPGKNQVVVMSYGLWQRRFGGDAAIVGRTITLNGAPRTVIGVLPPDFRFHFRGFEVWAPQDFLRMNSNRGGHSLNVVARLKPGVTLAQARADMEAIGRRLEEQYPDKNRGHAVNVFRLDNELVREIQPAVPVLVGAVGLVLLIACANVANLLLARAAARRREVAIRQALGAGRWRLIRQFLTESVMLALAGGAVGVLLALWGVHFVVLGIPREAPIMNEIRVDGWVLSFTLALSVATELLFGLAPALRASRADLGSALKTAAAQRLRGSASRLLVVSEVTLTVVLLAGAGLLLKSFLRLVSVDPGFRQEQVLTFQIGLPGNRYDSSARRAAFYQQLLEQLRALPAVRSVAAVNHLPLSGQDSSSNFQIEGRAPATTFLEQYNSRTRTATPDYFRAMGVPLLKGRYFTEADNLDASRVVIINQAMARRYWPDQEPLGSRIYAGGNVWREIVGVVGDMRHTALASDPSPEMFFPHAQEPSTFMNIVLRTAGNPQAVIQAARVQVRSLDRDLPLANVQTLEEVVADSVAQPRLYAALLGVFAALALALAAVGIYGVMSYSVTQRTQEIGVRMAIGARPRDVLRLVVRQGMALVGIGLAIGIAAAAVVTRLMSTLLYGVTPGDWLTYVAVSLVLATVALAASYLPARRAARVDPVVALRQE